MGLLLVLTLAFLPVFVQVGRAFAAPSVSPKVSRIAPAAGPLGGGTKVTITGSGFTGATAVHFGAAVASFTGDSATQITATAPVGSPGAVNVTVKTAGGTSATSKADLFTYDPVPTVTGIAPSAGPVNGGTQATITGTGFTGATAVHFGATVASLKSDSATQIVATAPVGPPGAADVTVTTAGGTSATSKADLFTYDPVPTVTGIAPSAGPVGGGTQVTITGTGFTGATGIDFGGTAAPSFTVDSDTQITANSPAGSAGVVDVTVVSPGGTSATHSADAFTYDAVVNPDHVGTVTGVSPDAGPPVGGVAVTITGTGFDGATAVAFGAVAALFKVDSATQITAIAPAESPGTVDVTVTNAGGASATSTADLFTYDLVPTVMGISPASGETSGGALVTISGTGFDGATAVDFGATAARSFTVDSATQITATAPQEPAGTISVTVEAPGGTSDVDNADQFTYTNVPVTPAVFGLSPSAGPVGGATKVTITGSNLTGATAVQFGSENAVSFEVVSANEIIAVSPPGGAGTVEVLVAQAGADSISSLPAGAFTYAYAPTVRPGAVSGAMPTTATLNAAINPNGLPLTSCQFQYGITSSYGQTAACAQPVSKTTVPVAVSAVLNGLAPATSYRYRITATTAAGTTDGPAATFTTPQLQPVGVPLVGLLLQRVTRRAGVIGKLLGIQGITRAARGESLVLRCVKACSDLLALDIPLDARVLPRRITLARALLISSATRIEIDVSARGKLSRYARYAFTTSGPNLDVRITRSGCLTPAGRVVKCPGAVRAP
ncbi:MAG: IPT/TIG domain-containing protein [Solirubrobacteraceae bacterium]